MTLCAHCSQRVPDGRASLGYTTCLKCGDRIATAQTNQKKKCVSILFNKGAYQYVTPKSDPKDFGRK